MSVHEYQLFHTNWPSASSCGPAPAVEDFVPITDRMALVTCGPTLSELNKVCVVDYKFTDSELLLDRPVVVAEGAYVRLGHLRDGRVVYSESRDGPHQPFEDFYTDDAPRARLYRGGKLFLDHWGPYVEVGNAWRDGKTLYFEARQESNSPPEGWELWTLDLDSMKKRQLCNGANPCVYRNHLYYSIWKQKEVHIAVRAVKD